MLQTSESTTILTLTKQYVLGLIIALLASTAIAQRGAADDDIEALTARAGAGELEAQKQLASHFSSGKQRDLRVAGGWLHLAAKQGDAASQTEWAYYLRTGQGGVDKNLEASAAWLMRAAEQDHGPAQMTLGWYYRNNVGVALDHLKAARWYERGLASTQWDNASVFYYLGELYRKGIGVLKNAPVSRKWYERAAESNHPPALYRMGLIHLNGQGVQANATKAAEYFRAVEAGVYDITGQDSNIQIDGGSIESAAKTNLGYLHYMGKGVPQDKALAASLFTQAAKHGNYSAAYNLGQLYYHGEGVTKDIEAAQKWLTQSAKQGYALAQVNLGHFYNNGVEVPRDVDQALHWYTKAADQGSQEGAKNVARIHDERQPKIAATQPAARPPPTTRKSPTPSYSPSSDVTAEDVLGGIAVIAGLAILADAITGDSSSNSSQESTRPMNQYIQQCREDVYRRIHRCYTHGSVCDLVGCVYEWTCQTPSGGRGECRRYTGYSDSIEDVFCDPKVGKDFRTEEEVMAYSCR